MDSDPTWTHCANCGQPVREDAPHKVGVGECAEPDQSVRVPSRSLVEVLHDALHAGAVESQITDDEYEAAVAWVDATQPTWTTAPQLSCIRDTPPTGDVVDARCPHGHDQATRPPLR